MKNELLKRISKIYKIYMAVFSVLFGISIIVCFCHIYLTEPNVGTSTDIYSPERVGFYLQYLSIPFALYVLSIIFGACFYYAHPQKVNENAKPWHTSILRRVKKYNIDDIEDENNKKLLKRNKIIRILTYCFTGAVVFVSLFVICWYLSNKEIYVLDDNIIKRNLDIFIGVLPFILISLIWGIAATFILNIVAKNDIDILKSEKQFKLEKQLKTYVKPKVENTIIRAAQIAVGALAITFIILGVFNGGVRDVFIKAINICTECIGLG